MIKIFDTFYFICIDRSEEEYSTQSYEANVQVQAASPRSDSPPPKEGIKLENKFTQYVN